MSLLTSSIDLDTITTPAIPNSQFPADQVNQLADLFLKAGDTVSPILVRKVSPIAFEVLEGYFEYYAAIKAQEIDEQFTAIRAYVVPPELESTILEQYQFLRSHSAPISNPPQASPETAPDLAKIEEAIANRLEQKLTAAIEKTIEDRISVSLQAIVGQVTKQLDAHLTDFRQSLSLVPIHQVLDPKLQPTASVPEPVVNKINQPQTLTKAKTTTKSPKPKSTTSKTTAKVKKIDNDNNDPKVLQVLHDLNTFNVADLERNLAKSAKGNIKFAKLIHQLKSQQPEQKFQSIKDVIDNVQGLADKTMQKIIDAW